MIDLVEVFIEMFIPVARDNLHDPKSILHINTIIANP